MIPELKDALVGLDLRSRPVSGGQQYFAAGSLDSHLTNPARSPDLSPPADTPFMPGAEKRPI